MRRAREAKRVREAGSRAPPPPPGGAPPRPHHLGESRFRLLGEDRVARNHSSLISSLPRCPSVAPSTSGGGPPPLVPAHLTRPQFWAFAGLSHLLPENSRRDLAPPGPTSGWSQGPRPRPGPTPPASSCPIRRRVPSHALIRPGSHRRDPSAASASSAQSYRALRLPLLRGPSGGS